MRRTTVEVLGLLLAFFALSAEAISIHQAEKPFSNLLWQGLEDEMRASNLDMETVASVLGSSKLQEIVQRYRQAVPPVGPKTGRDLLFLKDVWDKLKDEVQDLFAKVVGELGDLFDEDDFNAALKSAQDFAKPEKPFEVRNFTGGMMTGLLSVFMPRLEDSFDGMEAMTQIEACFNPAQLHATFFSQEALRLRLDPAISLTDEENSAFVEIVDKVTDNTKIDELKSLIQGSVNALKAMRKMTKVLRRLAPLLLALLVHSIDCGPGEVVVGMVLSFLVSMFPPLMLVLMPVGIGLIGSTIFAELKGLVKEYGQNWFRFGVHTGKVTGLVAGLIIAYKKSKNRRIHCTEKDGCGLAEFKDGASSDELNKDKYWTGKKKHGDNMVYQRDSLIDPKRVDSKGRTNLARMKSGLAPIGPDGQSLNLHHVSQSQFGPVAELTDSYHSRNHGALHVLCGSCESQIDRKAFAKWRRSYWIQRGLDMAAKVATDGSATWGLSPVFGAIASNPTTWQNSRKTIDDVLPTIIDEATSDMKSTSFLRLILKILKLVIASAARKEIDLENKGMGALEKCAFSDTCTDSLSISKLLSTTASIAKGLVKSFDIRSESVSWIRIQAQTNLTAILDGVNVQLAESDTVAIALKCGAAAASRLQISALTNNASFAVFFGDSSLAPCNDAAAALLPNVPGLVQRTDADNQVGGPSTRSVDNGGLIAGLVIGMLLLAAVVVVGVLLYRKKVAKETSMVEERLLPLDE